MKNITKTKLLFSSLLLVLGVLFVLPSTPAHGQLTGVVCIIPSGDSSCPSSPSTITGTVGSQLRVSVFIQNSDGLSGFDITLVADHTIIKPAGFDLTGSVLPGPQQVLVYCQGGILIQGSVCSSTDTVDTLHLAAADCLGCGNTPTPTTGLLFTAIYNVTTATGGTPLRFQTGCTTTSVSGTTTCVDIANGSLNPVPETVQAATFTTGDYTISASPTSLSLKRGSTAASTITLSSAGFAGTISLSTTIVPSTGHSPGTTLSSTSVTLSSGGSMSVTLTVSASKNAGFGTYTITVTGTSGATSHSVSLTATVTH